MHSTSEFKIKLLSDGTALLCDPEGIPVCVDASGRVRRTQNGELMTMKHAREFRVAQGLEELVKVPLQEYPDFVERYFSPRLNLRTQQIEINESPITEEQFESLHIYAAKQLGFKVRKADLQAQVRSSARQAEYDPIERYLSSLGTEGGPVLTDEEWDQIAVLALGLTDSWSRTVVQRFLLSAVARVMDPGCKVDFCLILFGAQGLGKSTFFRSLAGDSFSDSMGDLTNKKDDLLILHRNWLNEWSEADQIFVGAHRAEQIKRFVSSQEDSFRAPYGRTTQAFKRRSVLCGTTNRDDWANDPTGNRRFPILRPTEIDAEWISANRDRIWARVAVEWRRGARWWFDKEEEQQISEQAAQFAPSNDEVEEIWQYLNERKGERISTRDLLVLALGRDKDSLQQREVNAMARQLNALQTRGAFKERTNYKSRTTLSERRITTTVWSVLNAKNAMNAEISKTMEKGGV